MCRLCGALCPAPVCVRRTLVRLINLSSVYQDIHRIAHSSIFLLSLSLSFLNFSLMSNCLYDPVNNSFCLSSQSPFVPAIKLEHMTRPLNNLWGHVVKLDENYGLRVWRQEYFFWFSSIGLRTSLFVYLSFSSFFW